MPRAAEAYPDTRRVWFFQRRRTVRFRAQCLFAILCLLGLPIRAQAENRPPSLASDFFIKTWQVENGLPQSSVTATAQTPDGYLWLGTFGALARFDGVRFKVFDPGNTPRLGNCRVILMVTDCHGWLWILTEGNDLVRMANGVFERVNGRLGLPNRGIINLEADPVGVVWVISEGPAYFRFEQDHFVSRVPNDQFAADKIPSLKMTEGRAVWIRGESGWIWTGMTALSFALKVPAVGGPKFYRGRDNDVWMFADGQMRNLRTGRLVTPFPVIDPGADITDAAEDSVGNLWLGTWNMGIFVIQPSGAQTHIPLGKATGDESVRNFFIDAEDNVWAGMNAGGLVHVGRHEFRTFGKDRGLRDSIIKSVLEDLSGNIWVIHGVGIDCIPPNDIVEPKWSKNGLWSAARTVDGHIWIGNYGEELHRYENGKFFDCQLEKGLTKVLSLAPDRLGNMWIGTPGGLGKADGSGARVVPLPTGLKERDVRAMADDAEGHLYVGLNGGGLLRRTGDRWEQFSKPQGLTDDHTRSLLVETNGVVWVGTTSGGLNRFQNGQFTSFGSEDFPLPSLVSCVAEDDWGNLWLGSNTGIYRVNKRELTEAATGTRHAVTVRRYGKLDGLNTSECAGGMQPTVCKGHDGRLWFATVNGLSVVEPDKLQSNPRPPPVVIEELILDDKSVGTLHSEAQAEQPFDLVKTSGSGQRILSVPPGNHRLAIRYTGLSFRSPENVRFRYRLEGLDETWTEAGDRRIAYFQGLRAGNYRFRIIACNNDGIWNEAGASLALAVLPYIYQTSWFRGSAAAGLAGVLALAYHWRVKRLEADRAAQQVFSRQLIERQDSERKRIAAELHDSLGQDLLVIKNRALLGMGPAALNANEHLDEISKTASQALRQVRKIAYNLRPYQLDRLGLTEAIDALIQKISAAGPVKLEAEIDPVDKLFQPQDENHIFRILQEALNNILKHSGATTATVRVHRSDDELRMVITDNGSGFESASNHPLVKPSGSLGLSNMSERSGILRGLFQISSSPGNGTTVTITIPLPRHKDEKENPHPAGG